MALNNAWERAVREIGISRGLAQEWQDAGIRDPAAIDSARLDYNPRSHMFKLEVDAGSYTWDMEMSRPDQIDRWYLDDAYYLLDAYEIDVPNLYPEHGTAGR